MPLADVAPVEMPWLWPGRIPLGRITLLVGDPGLGKSLIALDVAARVSSGRAWPEEEAGSREHGAGSQTSVLSAPRPLPPAPCSVLLLTAEDGLADTIRPRLEAMGADCSRILAIQAVPGQASRDDLPRAFELRRDLARLASLVEAVPDCRLIIVDPISAYLGSTSEHANAEVQSLLLPLATLARERGLAVLAVSHLRKKQGAAIHRTMGSLAFVAAARAAWILTRDPENDGRRLMLPIKNNLASDVGGLAYTIETAGPAGPPIVRWLPESIHISIDAILAAGSGRPCGRPDDERQQAAGWLRQALADGPRAVREVQEEADANGFNPRTLRRAFRELEGEAVREGFGPVGLWLWKLPGTDSE